MCSTYYSFCGNAGLKQKDGSAGEFRAAICNKWLHPVAIRDHPAFASWVLYGRPMFDLSYPVSNIPVMYPVLYLQSLTCILMHDVSLEDSALLLAGHETVLLLCGLHVLRLVWCNMLNGQAAAAIA